nr:NotI family restriction endonuclease [Chloroflexus aggregans]
MSHSGQPLAEVFGHLVTDQTDTAKRYRSLRLCPFNNKVPNCTKDKAKNPLGVCSIYHENAPVITRLSLRAPSDFVRTGSLLTMPQLSFLRKEHGGPL